VDDGRIATVGLWRYLSLYIFSKNMCQKESVQIISCSSS
jgi:hypothetical protein